MSATPESVRRSLRILAVHRSLFPGRPTRGWGFTMTESDIVRVIEVFEGAGARWALVGSYAVGLLTEPRATIDFDFIIEERRLRPVLRELARVFGDLDEEDIGAAIRLRAIDVDLIRSNNHPLFREALDRARRMGDWRVPPPEVLIALKFLSAVNPWRNRDKRAQDLVDLRRIYHAVGPDDLDRSDLVRLSALVYPGAEREFEALLGRIERGDPIEL